MGFGGVAIAALYFVLRFGLAFSDGLGGEKASRPSRCVPSRSSPQLTSRFACDYIVNHILGVGQTGKFRNSNKIE